MHATTVALPQRHQITHHHAHHAHHQNTPARSFSRKRLCRHRAPFSGRGTQHAAASGPAGANATDQPRQQEQLNVVITGGSKGLGYCMAAEFLQAGDNVVICGRNADRLEAAVSSLKEVAARQQQQQQQPQVSGVVCDVSDAADVDRLQAFVANAFRDGPVNRWINNAGQVTRRQLLTELQPADISRAVGCNVLGSLLCCRAAIQLMQRHHEQQQQQQQQQQGAQAAGQQQQQQPQYHIFNMGFSSWGAAATKSACTHKSTKMALTQLNTSLADDLAEAGLGYIGVHNLSPGMVLTDLLLQGAPPTARRFFNALAEEPEVTAAAVVPQIRAIQGTRGRIEFLNPASAVGRVLAGLPQIIGGGRFFDKAGQRVVGTEEKGGSAPVYNSAGVRLLYDFPADKY